MNKDFYESVKESILSFMPEEYKNHNVRIEEVRKDGDISLHGLSLIEGDSGTAPILYLEPYAKLYEQGCSEEEIFQNIADEYDKIEKNVPNLTMPDMSYENIKEYLRVRLVYNKNNTDYLRDHISVDAGCGYSLIVYVDFSEVLFEGAIINLRKDMLKELGADEREIIKAGIDGSVKYCPAILSYLDEEVHSMLGDFEKEDLFKAGKVDHSRGALVLTTEDRFSGAATLFYPGVKERVAELVDWDYFIIPSSVHELLVIPADGTISAKELAMMVKTVNSYEVSKEEQLGNRVLFYDRTNNELGVICDLDKEKHRAEAR